jgi:hypothetical protein
MVSLLRPLDLQLAFEDRTYKLGEVIDLTIDVEARGEFDVREGRVDLLCEVQWTDVQTVDVPVSQHSDAGAPPGLGGIYIPHRIPKQVTKDYKETTVYGSIVFLQNARLRSGEASRYIARLEIQSQPPDHAAKGEVRWGLVAPIDVIRARDAKSKHNVKVAIT